MAPRHSLDSGMCARARRPRPAAYKAYVSNEKGNTISVIDTSARKVVETIKVGQRPRGIALTKDQKYVLVAVGDDDTIQMIDTDQQQGRRYAAVGPRPRTVRRRPRGQYPLRGERERQHRDDHRHREAGPAGRGRGRRRAGRHGPEPGREDTGQHLRDHQHGALHRHRFPPGHRQCPGRRRARVLHSSRTTAQNCGSRPKSAER